MAKDAPATVTRSKPKRRFGRQKLPGANADAGAGAGASGILAYLGWARLARQPPPSEPLSEPARALLAAAWEGLDPARVLDFHVHLVGVGTGGSGCYVNPQMRSLAHPKKFVRFDIYRRAAGIDDLATADQHYVSRLTSLARMWRPHLRMMALAFDRAHREDGSVDEDATEFHVPNDYALAVAREHADVVVAAGSIHPYRDDALAELDRIAEAGVKCIKWLPSAMRIDPASARCDALYRRLAALGMPLLTHTGKERAVDAHDAQKLANPLRLRRALDAGVKVIMCHCASSGDGEDLDAAGEAKPRVANFELFVRMMDDGRYADRLYGDLSALVQFNRCDKLTALLHRTDLHSRLINGSDYPMPAINVLVRTRTLVRRGLISAEQRRLLNEIDRHNPLLFDFALKRTVRGPSGERLADSAFMLPAGLLPAG